MVEDLISTTATLITLSSTITDMTHRDIDLRSSLPGILRTKAGCGATPASTMGAVREWRSFKGPSSCIHGTTESWMGSWWKTTPFIGILRGPLRDRKSVV